MRGDSPNMDFMIADHLHQQISTSRYDERRSILIDTPHSDCNRLHATSPVGKMARPLKCRGYRTPMRTAQPCTNRTNDSTTTKVVSILKKISNITDSTVEKLQRMLISWSISAGAKSWALRIPPQKDTEGTDMQNNTVIQTFILAPRIQASPDSEGTQSKRSQKNSLGNLALQRRRCPTRLTTAFSLHTEHRCAPDFQFPSYFIRIRWSKMTKLRLSSR